MLPTKKLQQKIIEQLVSGTHWLDKYTTPKGSIVASSVPASKKVEKKEEGVVAAKSENFLKDKLLSILVNFVRHTESFKLWRKFWQNFFVDLVISNWVLHKIRIIYCSKLNWSSLVFQQCLFAWSFLWQSISWPMEAKHLLSTCARNLITLLTVTGILSILFYEITFESFL